MSTEEKPVRKEVLFDLPFLILVKDGFRDQQLEDWVEAYKEGKDLPYSPYAPLPNEKPLFILGGSPVHTPTDIDESPYMTRLDNGKYVGLQFLARINQRNSAKMVGEVFGDRTGKASFSSVRALYDLSKFEQSEIWNYELFIDYSLEAINKYPSYQLHLSHAFSLL